MTSRVHLRKARRGGRAISDITFDQISGTLGSFLLVWASVERCVREEIVSVRGSHPHGMGAILAAWEETVIERQPETSLCPLLASMLRSRLQGPLHMRNGICHGLEGISAADGERPATLRWEINGEKHWATWADMQSTLNWLSRVRRAFAIISNPSLEKPGSRGIDNRENRLWWRTEFDLLLPRE